MYLVLNQQSHFLTFLNLILGKRHMPEFIHGGLIYNHILEATEIPTLGKVLE